MKQYLKQSTDYSCGPACLKMIFSSYGKELDEKELIKRCEANEKTGTAHKKMMHVAREEGFIVQEGHTTIEGLKALLQVGKVVVNYRDDEGEGHYAIVHNIKKDYLILIDPWYGPRYRIPREGFTKRWSNNNHSSSRWYLLITQA